MADVEHYEDLHDDYEPCMHDCDEMCDLEGCHHEHCFNCGGCQCAGYCDDYQTYNLRPDETGGEPEDECEGAPDPDSRREPEEPDWGSRD